MCYFVYIRLYIIIYMHSMAIEQFQNLDLKNLDVFTILP